MVKVADFGTARMVGIGAGASRAATTTVGTPYFMAPELILDNDDETIGYGTKADIWSIGITVAELLNCGEAPWPKFNNPGQAFFHIAGENNSPIIPDHLTDLGKDFIRTACTRDPKKRPSARELLEHPWLARRHESKFAVDGSGGQVLEHSSPSSKNPSIAGPRTPNHADSDRKASNATQPHQNHSSGEDFEESDDGLKKSSQ